MLLLDNLTKGVHYLEFDLLDFDPFHENGVTAHQLRLLEVMAGYFLLNESTNVCLESQPVFLVVSLKHQRSLATWHTQIF